MIQILRSERGLSLTELAIIGVLATLVMIGLVGFYINSQATWVDGSTQAQTQRELTLLTEVMGDAIHSSSRAWVSGSPDSLHSMLHLYGYKGQTEKYFIWWKDDSTVHVGTGLTPPGDHGPVIASKVETFQLHCSKDSTLVELTLLQARTAQGQVVRTATRYALYNR